MAEQDRMTEQMVKTTDLDDEPVTLRFTGRQVAGDGETTVWLVDDGRVLLVDPERYDEFADAAGFADWVREPQRSNQGRSAEQVLVEAVTALGIPRVIDL
jgi:hypothetical protein